MFDLKDALRSLAQNRPLFHSEADFQHALAWEIHERWPALSVRLEAKPLGISERIYIDIWIMDGSSPVAIELKYKTRRLNVTIDGEVFALLDQSAQDIGRYDFLADLQRLERVCGSCSGLSAYGILLTNDSSYWKTSLRAASVDAQFRLHEGRDLKGELAWGLGASKGTMRNRESPVALKGTYAATWNDYSEILGDGSYRQFRYLLIPVLLPL